jgi:hypothetical protein
LAILSAKARQVVRAALPLHSDRRMQQYMVMALVIAFGTLFYYLFISCANPLASARQLAEELRSERWIYSQIICSPSFCFTPVRGGGACFFLPREEET